MSKIAIVVGNPMRDSYSEALGQAYLRGAESGGHEAKLFVLARMNFDAILREGYRREQPLEPDLVAARAGACMPAITWCSCFRFGAATCRRS